ncbi:MAG: ribosome small subunit-dependent GTPase A [Firmicutes bacterium]|nr:ribosome small subunit-dependent GTPase A [Bacillota bacterium]
MQLTKKQKLNRELGKRAKGASQISDTTADIASGKILRAKGGKFVVLCLSEKKEFTCLAKRIILKDFGELLAGDAVDFCKKTSEIIHVQERTNVLIRPPVANLDQVIIVIAQKPAPDYALLDKILIDAFSLDIEPIIVINKVDLEGSEVLIKHIKDIYTNVVGKTNILQTCAKVKQKGARIKGITTLKKKLLNNFSCFAGQSAVGKSALMNALFPNLNLQTGDLSAKIDRGKHTTRYSRIYYEGEKFVCDTPGFSLLDLKNIQANHLSDYYPDYKEFAKKCKFNNCNHIGEIDCNIKAEVEKGTLDKARYERYIAIYNELLECICSQIRTKCKRPNCKNL